MGDIDHHIAKIFIWSNFVMDVFVKNNKVPVNNIYCFSNCSNVGFFCNSRLGTHMEGQTQFLSLTSNELFDGDNLHVRKNEHHYQSTN